MTRRLRSIGLAALLLAAPLAAADLDKGLSAVEKKDWAAALSEFQPLAESGNADAQVNLGNLYMKGHGVEQDYQAAYRWYLRAAQQGQAMAQGKLGVLNYYGLGVSQNTAEAVRWFRQAAENGDADAASVLASLYAAGDGVEASRPEAYLWYSIAADRGHPGALENRDGLVQEMTPGEVDQGMEKLAAWRRAHEPPETPLDAGAAPGKSGKPKAGAETREPGGHEKGRKPPARRPAGGKS
jgi:TPR repeat protein